MKKIFIITVLLSNSFFLFSQQNSTDNSTKNSSKSSSNEIKDVKNVVKINFGQLGNTGGVGFFYERMLNPIVSVSLGISGKYNSASIDGTGSSGLIGSEKTSGLGYMPEVRFYPIPNYHAPRGLYLSAFYNYYNEKYEIKGYTSNKDETIGSVSTTFNSIGGTIGWMFRIKSSFVIDLGFGPVFQSIESPSFYDIKTINGNKIISVQSPNLNSTQLTGTFRFSLGYAF